MPFLQSLHLGLHRPLRVREEIIASPQHPCRFAYVSDIHLRRGRSHLLGSQVIAALEKAEPDVILLGGDLVDQASELDALRSLIVQMLGMAPVFAIPGNHDLTVGEPKVRKAVMESGAHWLQGRTESFVFRERRFSISGPGGLILPDCDAAILCAHNPSIWKHARHAGYDLVFAGHLHGCQWVWFEAGGRLFPGACFYPFNHRRQQSGSTHLLVSMGCSDLIPIRWGCPREIILCIL